jgi:peptide/nickel transport system permease protein
MPGFAKYLARRFIQIVATLVVIVIINFALLHSTPGDLVDVLASESQASDPQYLIRLRHELGLDLPILEQLGHYILKLLSLDLGYSYRNNTSVLDLILSRLPATLLLMVTAVLLAFGLGTVLGAVAARRLNSFADALISVTSMLFYATPTFLVGLLMILLFSVTLRWLPLAGMVTAGAGFSGWGHVQDVLTHLAMPAAALSLFYVAVYTRLMRASMLEILGLDYIRTARAKGLSWRRILYRHAVRNAMLPMVTMCGLQVSSLFGGAIVVETIFGWPGMGLLAFNAVFQRDFVLLLGILFFSSLVVLVVSLVVDLLYMRLDPRIRIA